MSSEHHTLSTLVQEFLSDQPPSALLFRLTLASLLSLSVSLYLVLATVVCFEGVTRLVNLVVIFLRLRYVCELERER